MSLRLESLRYPLAILFLAACWQAVYLLGVANPKYFPSIVDVTRSGQALIAEGFLNTIGISFLRAFVGLAAASAIGIALAIASDFLPAFGKGFRYISDIVQPIPPAALVPLSVFALGLGWKLYAFLIILIAVWPTYMNGTAALAAVSPVQINAGRMLGCDRWTLMRDIKLPAAWPEILSGMRYAATLAVISVTVCEMLAGRDGVGFMIFKKAFALRTADVFALMFIVAINGLILTGLVDLLRRMTASWHVHMMERRS